MNIRNRFGKLYIHGYFQNCKLTMEFIKERGICLKINVDLFLNCGNKFTDLERKYKVNR